MLRRLELVLSELVEQIKQLSLPIPDDDVVAHCEKVRAYIMDEIVHHGSIDFARYMQLALYEPGLGYYAVGTQKFGAGGDFITAPEISFFFGQCLANYFCHFATGRSNQNILEIGPGSGKLACDILKALAEKNNLPEKYFLLEVSADLRERQRALLEHLVPELMSRVEWLTAWPENNSFDGLVIANEVLDAMPVHIFQINGDIQQRCVDVKDNMFVWTMKPAPDELKQTVTALGIDFHEGYYSEVNLQLRSWLHSLYGMMHSGDVILIDYGFPAHEYYHPQRHAGTIMCHYQHRAFDNPLVLPGIQDITAHVDFTAVANAAEDAGYEVKSITNQANFLLENDLILLAQQAIDSGGDQFEIAHQMKQLMMPTEMGELFKVATLTKG